jgi:hypothetical protein
MNYLFNKNLDLVEKINISVAYLLSLSLIIAIISSAWTGNWEVLFISTVTLLLFYLPAVIEKQLHIHLPVEMEFVIVLFVYAALFLGEVKGYYTAFWWWDVVLHIGSGIVLGFAGFIILFSLYTRDKVAASSLLIAIFSFCFALAIGAVWEIFEYAMDRAFGLNMQRSGLTDTMWDLIVDSGGALLASILGFIYIKGGKTYYFEHLLRKFISENPQLNKSSLK